MKSTIALFLLIAFLGITRADYSINQWADHIFSELRNSPAIKSIDPMNMAPFNFKIMKTGITNRDVKAAFLHGMLFGLTMLQRNGDCTNGTQGGEYVVGCYISLQPITVRMNADVKGDEISGTMKHLSTLSTVNSNTRALVEFRGRRGWSVVRAPITVTGITLTSQFVDGTKLSLNTNRMNQFMDAMNREISLQIRNAVTTYYERALWDVATGNALP